MPGISNSWVPLIQRSRTSAGHLTMALKSNQRPKKIQEHDCDRAGLEGGLNPQPVEEEGGKEGQEGAKR